jgi:hypothetical protein
MALFKLIYKKYIILIAIVLSLLNVPQTNALIVISIGGDCTLASVLRTLNLRTQAFPFDWMFSSFSAVYSAFEDNFSHFLDPASLRVSDDKKMIIDHYGLLFVHDFPTIHHPAAINEDDAHDWAEIRSDWRASIPAIRAKYGRRIARVQAALKSTDTVYFLRYGILKKDALKLRDLFIDRYPKLNFTIIAVNNVQGALEKIEIWNLEKIKNFYIQENGGPLFWSSWKQIFSTLQINQGTLKNI